MEKPILIYMLTILVLISGCKDVINDLDEKDRFRQGIEINEALLVNSWDITFYREFGIDESEAFENSVISFLPNGDIDLTIDANEYDGQWALAKENRLLVLRINSNQNPQTNLSNEWVVQELNQDILKIIEEDKADDAEFHFRRKEDISVDWSLLYKNWQVSSFTTNGNDLSSQFSNLVISFQNDKTLLITDLGRKIHSFSYQQTASPASIDLNQNTSTDQNLNTFFRNWQIKSLSGNRLELISAENELVLTKYNGELSLNPVVFDPEQLQEKWSVYYYLEDDEDETDDLENTIIWFKENGELTVKLPNGINYVGVWFFSLGQDLLQMNIDINDDYTDYLDDTWKITFINQDTLKMIENGDTDTELSLRKNTGVFNPYPDDLIKTWKLTDMDQDDDGDDESTEYEGLEISFGDDFTIDVLFENMTSQGSWSIESDQITLQFTDLQDISGTYFISEISQDQLKLSSEDIDLTFEPK